MCLFENSFTNNMFTKKTAPQKRPWQHTFTTTTKNKYSRKKSFKRRNIEITMLTLLHLNG